MTDFTTLSLIVIVIILLIAALAVLHGRSRAQPAAPTSPVQTLYPPPAATVYGDFRNQYIDPKGNFGAWHDGLDESVFARLSPAERERAEAEMIAALPDWRCIVGLGQIRSQKAIEPLKRLETTLDGEQIVRVERALQQIGAPGDEPPGAKTRRVLSGQDRGSNKLSRMDAAIALRNFPSAGTASVLRQAAREDDDYLVRYHAVNSLLLISGYSEAEADDIMRGLAPKLGGGHPNAEAQAQIDRLIAGRQAGSGEASSPL